MIWFDGRFAKEAKVPLFSHSFNYGGAVFDSARVYPTSAGPAFFRPFEHIRRFYGAIDFCGYSVRHNPAKLWRILRSMASKEGNVKAYARMAAFLGHKEFRVHPSSRGASLALSLEPLEYAAVPFNRGYSCIFSGWQRPSALQMPVSRKFSGNYLNSFFAVSEARAKGYDEALLLDADGFVCEGSAENIFIVKNGTLHTPPTTQSLLPGITRDSVIQLARLEGVPFREKKLKPKDVVGADEVFLTGTAIEIMPVRKIGKNAFNAPGPVTRILAAAFKSAVSGSHILSEEWLVPA